jgi:two-component system OmpR family response regulator
MERIQTMRESLPDGVFAPQILVVEDHTATREVLSTYLTKNGFRVTSLASGDGLMEQLQAETPHLILLDVMLPGKDGVSLCRDIRNHYAIPIILVTAVDEHTEKVVALELGADDYVMKPFNPRELLARIRAVLRRTHTSIETASATPAAREVQNEVRRAIQRQGYQFSTFFLQHETRQLFTVDGQEIILTSNEYRLLHLFVDRPQRVLSRDWLLDELQGRERDPLDRSIDVQMSRLRQKLNDGGRTPKLIKTIRNEGYILACEVICEK